MHEISKNVGAELQQMIVRFMSYASCLLLNNLLAILGKDKVEQWMKNKWLQFKENPEVRFIESESQQIA